MRTVSRFFLVLCLLGVAVPLGWVLLSSVKSGAEILGHPWALPNGLHWSNYAKAWGEAGIGRAFLNSLVVTLATLAILLPIGAMAAYVLAKYAFVGRRAVQAVFLSGMMFPHFLVVVPLFLMLRDLRLLDTLTGLVVVYVAYSLSFTIFVLTGFFQTLPDELAEAASLDGASHATIFWRLILPNSGPALATVGIFAFIYTWRDFMGPLLYLNSPENQTLELGLNTYRALNQEQWELLMAGSVLVMIPLLILFLLGQRYFVKGIVMSGGGGR